MQNNLTEAFTHLNNGDFARARGAFQLALKLDANDVGALSGMAAVLHNDQDLVGALTHSEAALKLNPRNAELHVHHAQYLLAANQPDKAKTSLKKAHRLGSGAPDTLYNLGVMHSIIGEFKQAKKCLLKANGLDKKNPQILETLGTICAELGDIRQAVKFLRSCIEIVPGSPVNYLKLGKIYYQSSDYRNALECFSQALVIDDANSDAYLSLSSTYFKMGQIDQAIEVCKKSLSFTPDDSNTHYNLAKYYSLRKNLNYALHHSKMAFELAPMDSDAAAIHYQFRRQACDWQNLDTLSNQLDEFLFNGISKPTAELPFINVFRSSDSAINHSVAQARSAKISAGIPRDMFQKRIERRREKLNVLQPQPPIEIGYVSSDFRDHPTGHLMQHFFELHDRERFSVHAYSHGPDDHSVYRESIRDGCDGFTDIRGLNDIDAAKRIANDNIDILIDLNVHITGERMGICAYRPAPIQISLLAFPGTSGADYYDFVVTDKIVTPLEDEKSFSEKFFYMPDTYFITNPKIDVSKRSFSRKECGLPETIEVGAVFACFNNSYKIEPNIFDAWLNVLRSLPGSVLWLFANNDVCQSNLRRFTSERGIDENRLVFAEDLPKPEHLTRLSISDLALDTGIYGGHTTTADALFVSVPTITLQGSHFASRASGSILNALGLSELICKDLTAYESLARQITSNTETLLQLKKKIENNKTTHPLFCAKTYMCHFEDGLEAAYKMWRNNQDFDHITI